jgi:hypothetical protein
MSARLLEEGSRFNDSTGGRIVIPSSINKKTYILSSMSSRQLLTEMTIVVGMCASFATLV